MFKNVNDVADSISLIVTKTSPGRRKVHIKALIDQILNDNKVLTDDVRTMMKYLTKSIEVFPTPVEEGIVNESHSNILQSIDQKTKYLPTKIGSANVVIAKDSEDIAKILFETS
jgi:hypothetical protein